MTPDQISAVQTTFQVATENDSDIIASFYTRLMAAHPDDIAPLFGAPGAMTRVQVGMGGALTDIIGHLGDDEHLGRVLVTLGRWHSGIIKQWMYDPVFAVLADTIADACGDDWSDEAAEAWAAMIAAVKVWFMEGFTEKGWHDAMGRHDLLSAIEDHVDRDNRDHEALVDGLEAFLEQNPSEDADGLRKVLLTHITSTAASHSRVLIAVRLALGVDHE